MNRKDLKKVAEINKECFNGCKWNNSGFQWIKCNFKAWPRCQYWIAELGSEIIGYILWIEKSGFRKQAIFELEQIGIKKEYRGKGIGSKLIKVSLSAIKKQLKKEKRKLKLVLVTTSNATKLYEKTLKAKQETLIKEFF